jgi:hypothetical protein
VRRAGLAALLLATPLLIAATPDPAGDVSACAGTGSVRDPVADVVSVDAIADELGTAAVWRITFAAPVPVPDTDGAPLRIDVLVRDPELPAVSVGTERGMNRIVRWDATAADAPIEIAWLGGEGHTPFNPPEVSGRTVEIRVPGRILLGEAADGTEGVRRARWSVSVRDGDACDRVGAIPSFRLREQPAPSDPTDVPLGGNVDRPAAGIAGPWFVPALLLVIASLVGLAAVARRLVRR